MTEKRSAIDDAKALLLSPDEKVACQALAAAQSGLVSQRASGLLALDGGAAQLMAAELSGLTIGQIRYLLTIFRRKGMTIFPAIKLPSSAPQVAASQPEAKISVEPAAEGKTVQSAKKDKKKAAVKKGKGKAKGASKGREKKSKDKKVGEKTKKKKKDKAKKVK